MEFPEKYIKKGKFKLHSGEISDTFYDVNLLLTDKRKLKEIKNFIRFYLLTQKYLMRTFVGIATGGAIIASHFDNFAMIKDGELKGFVKEPYCIIDDVVTTENSLKEAIQIIGHNPKYIFVVVDRRKNKTLNITSMFNIKGE